MSPRLDGLDPSVIVEHGAVDLYDMWKAVSLRYQRSLANFTKSGEHDADFFGYCGGSLDVYYLRECLEAKHNLPSFVEGGMLEEDQFDSLKRSSDDSFTHSPLSKKMKLEMLSTVKGIAEKLVDDIPSSVDAILKMHKLIEHVERRLPDLKDQGTTDVMLEHSATVYRQKLLEMEARLCATE